MEYPGNTALAPEIQQRVIVTFRQTVSLAAKGSREEALLGCDFILRLDSLFEPARVLLTRVQEGSGPVEVEDLKAVAALELEAPEEEPAAEQPRPEVAPPTTAAAAAEPSAGPPPLVEHPEELFQEALDAVEKAPPEESTAPVVAPAEAVPAATPVRDSDSESRIQQLLAEGQGAFDSGDFQGAIDAWSRIFLIDIDHTEAGQRIEMARQKKAEAEREIEQAFNEALTHLETGDLKGAKASFQQVLTIHPNHLAAREYLEKIENGTLPEIGGPAVGPPPIPPPPRTPAQPASADRETDEVDLDAFAPEPPIPAGPPRQPTRRVAAASGAPSRSRTFLMVGGAVLLLVLVGGWFLLSNWGAMFPNSQTEEPVAPIAEADPLARATDLHLKGNTNLAVAQLRRLPPSHPQYEQAQGLISRWEGAGEEAEAPDDSSGETRERFEALIEEARAAFSRKEFLRATEILDQAETLAPIEGEAADLRSRTAEKLEPIQRQIDLFRQGEWEFALPDLWRHYLDNPGDRVAERLIVDSYYNLGVRDLQRGDPVAAAQKFQEAISLGEVDPDILRVARFAGAYQTRPQDLLYRIFVKYLPFR